MTVGLFRLSGSKKGVDSLKKSIEDGNEINFSEIADPNEVASLLKVFFQELPDALIPKNNYEAIYRLAGKA